MFQYSSSWLITSLAATLPSLTRSTVGKEDKETQAPAQGDVRPVALHSDV